MAEKSFVCPIWKTPAKHLAGERYEGFKVYSSRAGGEYRITREAMDDHSSLEPRQQAIVTTWMVDQRRYGTSAPLLTSSDLETILKGRPLRFSEKRERFFLALLHADIRPGAKIDLTNDFRDLHSSEIHIQSLMAWMGAENFQEGIAVLEMMIEDGYLRLQNPCVSPTHKCFERIEAFQGNVASKQVFMAMWFDSEMNEVWRTGFAPAIRDAGYEPFRIDTLEHNGKIDDEIVAQIRRSRFLVADFTCGGKYVDNVFHPNPRGGVYYEAGLAYGLGMEVIFTCREDRLDYLHFDTRQFAHIVWKSSEDLRVQLYNRIAATVKEGPEAPGPGRSIIASPSGEQF